MYDRRALRIIADICLASTAVLGLAKLAGWVSWSWVVVAAPIWVPVALGATCWAFERAMGIEPFADDEE
jgi:hypothetical protein